MEGCDVFETGVKKLFEKCDLHLLKFNTYPSPRPSDAILYSLWIIYATAYLLFGTIFGGCRLYMLFYRWQWELFDVQPLYFHLRSIYLAIRSSSSSSSLFWIFLNHLSSSPEQHSSILLVPNSLRCSIVVVIFLDTVPNSNSRRRPFVICLFTNSHTHIQQFVWHQQRQKRSPYTTASLSLIISSVD